MGINLCYQQFIENPGVVVLLALPENYRKEDFSEYLDEQVLYIDCREINQKNRVYTCVSEALKAGKILCMDHINRLANQPFWSDVSELVLSMLRQKDYCTEQGVIPVSQIRLLLPYSDSEIEDTCLEENILQLASRNSMMIMK